MHKALESFAHHYKIFSENQN